MPLYQPDLILEEVDGSDGSDDEIMHINKEIKQDLARRESKRVAELSVPSLQRHVSAGLCESTSERRESRQLSSRMLQRGLPRGGHGIAPYATPRRAQDFLYTQAQSERFDPTAESADGFSDRGGAGPIELSDASSAYVS